MAQRSYLHLKLCAAATNGPHVATHFPLVSEACKTAAKTSRISTYHPRPLSSTLPNAIFLHCPSKQPAPFACTFPSPCASTTTSDRKLGGLGPCPQSFGKPRQRPLGPAVALVRTPHSQGEPHRPSSVQMVRGFVALVMYLQRPCVVRYVHVAFAGVGKVV